MLTRPTSFLLINATDYVHIFPDFAQLPQARNTVPKATLRRSRSPGCCMVPSRAVPKLFPVEPQQNATTARLAAL